jgi:hypothetical protein
VAWRWRNDGVPTPTIAPVTGGGEDEVLQHRGVEIEVNIGRNDEKSGWWR